MADYSFAPSGGPKGFLGAYNFGIDTEKTLQDMGQKKETHDLRTLQDRLNYDIARKNEEVLGDLKRQSAVRDIQDTDELRPWMKESARAKAGQEVSRADIANRMIEADIIQKKMDSMETAEAYLRSRGGERGEMVPAPSDLDKSYEQLRTILRNGGWEDSDIEKYSSKGPQALTEWVIEGARAAKVDAPKLAERRKQLHALTLAGLQHPPSPGREYSPSMRLATLVGKEDWLPADQQNARNLLELVAKDMKESTFMALMSMQNLKYEPAEAMRMAGELTRMNLQNTFPDIIRRMGGLPTAVTSKGDPGQTNNEAADNKTVKFDPNAKAGSKTNPKKADKPSDIPKKPDGNWYVGPDGSLYDNTK